MDKVSVEIRKLRQSDVDFAMELKNIAGWNQTRGDWLRYMELEPEGCFLAEVNGEKAATAIALSYQESSMQKPSFGLGWIGMVLVHPDKRRMGLGTKLLKHGISYLQDKKIDCIKLDATPMGKKVYIPLGFVDEYEVYRFKGKGFNKGLSGVGHYEQGLMKQTQGTVVNPVKENNLKEIIELDSKIFGINRADVIRKLYQQEPELCFYTYDDSGVSGYLFAHKGYEAYQIGPWIAQNVITAELLLSSIMRIIGNEEVYFDIPANNKKGQLLIEKYNFSKQRSFCRMYLGDNSFPGTPELVYSSSGPEKG